MYFKCFEVISRLLVTDITSEEQGLVLTSGSLCCSHGKERPCWLWEEWGPCRMRLMQRADKGNLGRCVKELWEKRWI